MLIILGMSGWGWARYGSATQMWDWAGMGRKFVAVNHPSNSITLLLVIFPRPKIML
jgi:hypothetical protein